jgi:hypothetical protein
MGIRGSFAGDKATSRLHLCICVLVLKWNAMKMYAEVWLYHSSTSRTKRRSILTPEPLYSRRNGPDTRCMGHDLHPTAGLNYEERKTISDLTRNRITTPCYSVRSYTVPISLAARLHQGPSLRARGAIFLLHPYIFMVWCLTMHRGFVMFHLCSK